METDRPPLLSGSAAKSWVKTSCVPAWRLAWLVGAFTVLSTSDPLSNTPLVLVPPTSIPIRADINRHFLCDHLFHNLYFQLFYDNNMLESISRQVSTVYFADLELTDQRVKTVLGRIPRDQFVPEEYRRYAYENTPLPIGYGQTISQPYIVGLMTELLALKPTDRVLEIGTGSGYQTAVLAELAAHVYSIETVEPLAKSAQEVLTRLGYDNISFRIADGYFGWEEASPFDAILIAAAAEEVPPPLKEQLANGGRLVLPIGPPGGTQTLWRITKQNNNFVRENKGIVRFVPFTRRK